VFDYEEGCDFTAIGLKVGTSAARAQQLLNAKRMCSSPLGDVNGDAATDQINGNVIRVEYPSVHLPAGSEQAALEGDSTQEIVTTSIYNEFGQLTEAIDQEGNVTRYFYHAASLRGRRRFRGVSTHPGPSLARCSQRLLARRLVECRKALREVRDCVSPVASFKAPVLRLLFSRRK
jgi:YD repeat-containing protein